VAVGDEGGLMLHEGRLAARVTARKERDDRLKFEDCLARLERSWPRWKPANLPLEDSLKVFEEGVSLARHCTKYSTRPSAAIELLAKDEAGRPRPSRSPGRGGAVPQGGDR